jgi:hypothetical protein
MARNYSNQWESTIRGYREDYGYVSFTTTSSVVTINTSLRTIRHADVQLIGLPTSPEIVNVASPSFAITTADHTANPDTLIVAEDLSGYSAPYRIQVSGSTANDGFYTVNSISGTGPTTLTLLSSDGLSDSTGDGSLVINPVETVGGVRIIGGTLSVTRVATPIYLESALTVVTGNDFDVNAIGVCPFAGTLNEAWFYNDVTEGGGSGLINIGHIPTNGTGTLDADEFLADAAAEAMPADNAGKAITTFTSADVGADDLITMSTTNGATSAPSGGWGQVKITPDLSSAPALFYILRGQ